MLFLRHETNNYPTNVNDPIITATNTASATDANDSPTTPVNIE